MCGLAGFGMFRARAKRVSAQVAGRFDLFQKNA